MLTVPNTSTTIAVQDPAIGIDSDGNAVAVFSAFDGTDKIVQSARLPWGGTWTIPETISAPAPIYNSPDGKPLTPAIAVDPQGNAVAIWTEFDGVNCIIQGARLPKGGSWTKAVNVSLINGQAPITASQPSIAIDLKGNAVAVWICNIDPDTYVIQGAMLPFEGSWTTPVNISTTVNNDASYGPISLAIDASGNAITVWEETDGTNYMLQAATLPYGQSWTAPVSITIASPSNAQVNPKIAVDSAGNAVAVWTEFDGTNFMLQGATLPFGKSWSRAETISNPTSGSFIPSIAIDFAGNAIAVWSQFDGKNTMIQYARLAFGKTWTSPMDLSYASVAIVTNPQIAFDSSGNALVTWMRESDVNTNEVLIQSAVISSDGKGLWPMNVAGAGAEGALSPFSVLAMNSNGNAIVAWPNQSSQHIQSVRLAPAASINPSMGPLPPSKFKGSINKKRCSRKRKCVLEVTWEGSPSSDVIAYRIYRKSKVIATIPAQAPLRFEKMSSKKRIKGYRIAAVNKDNQESKRIKLKMKVSDN